MQMDFGSLSDCQAAPEQTSVSTLDKGRRQGFSSKWEIYFLGQVFFEVCRWQFHLHLMSFRLFPFCCAKHLSQLGLIWWGHAVTLDPLDLKWNHLTRKESILRLVCQTFDIHRCVLNVANYPLASLGSWLEVELVDFLRVQHLKN